MEFFLTTIHDLWATIHSGSWPELGSWSYILLILLVMTEGPVSTLLGAAAAAAGILDIRFVFASALIGNVLGDCLWYTVGSVSSLDRIHRFGRLLGIRKHHLDKLEFGMHAHATKLIALSKLAIGLIIPTLVAAGLARVPWRRWFPLVLVIETAWTIIMVNVGFHATGFITRMEQGLEVIGFIVLGIVVIGVLKFGSHFFQHGENEQAEELSVGHAATPMIRTTMQPTHTIMTSSHVAPSRGAQAHVAPHAAVVNARETLVRTTKTIATKSQAIGTVSVPKPVQPTPIHFSGD